MKIKRCIKCKQLKLLIFFYRRSESKDGRANTCKQCSNERKAAWRSENRTADAENMNAWRASHPEEDRAHTVIKNAIRSGNLIPQPCQVCGSTPTEAHHNDYSKPLEVEWLCKKHHSEIHSTKAMAE